MKPGLKGRSGRDRPPAQALEEWRPEGFRVDACEAVEIESEYSGLCLVRGQELLHRAKRLGWFERLYAQGLQFAQPVLLKGFPGLIPRPPVNGDRRQALRSAIVRERVQTRISRGVARLSRRTNHRGG